jgi:hypothetical protein
MSITRNLSGAFASAGFLFFAGASVAHAGEPITVYTDHSRILTVARAPATIVVGNPSIADVTIQGNQVFLHARSFGTTNVIIMDAADKMLADYEVTVQTGGDDNVYVFKSGSLNTYVCAPECEATLHVGDDKDYFMKWIAPEQQRKIGIALGQKEGENVSPQNQDAGAPQ